MKFSFQGLEKGHCTIVGQTGSGKTFFASKLLEHLARKRYIFIHDYKDEFSTILEHVKVKGIAELKKEKNHKFIIYVPTSVGNTEENEFIFNWIYNGKNRVLYVDEAYSISSNGLQPESFTACLTRGRSRNIQVITATQRPSWSGNFIFSEARNMIVFHLSLPVDRKKIKDICNIDPVGNKDYFFNVINENNNLGKFRLGE